MKALYIVLAVVLGIIALWSFLMGLMWLTDVDVWEMTVKEKMVPISLCVAGIVWLIGLIVLIVHLIDKIDDCV